MDDIRTRTAELSGAIIPELRELTTADLRAALAAGWRDFIGAPLFGLFFAAFYVLGGLALYFGLLAAGEPVWFVFVAAGFPLLAPFAAVGLYEVSHRRETGEPLSWGPVLGALRGQGDGQLPVMAVVVLLVFGFWIILARGLVAIFVGQTGITVDIMDQLLSLRGVSMLLVGSAVGGALALMLFTITAFSLPMLLDRRVDFMTAIITSMAAVRANPGVMARWAAIIVALTVLAMVPLFLGLFLVLPLLGHATWHLYRRTVVG
ncbi:MAG: putative integral membrane protein [Rhodobacteraceae bacterium HLUCCA12]|nr:MAG: putative integral membrane protein [Rhodobacteraceae bacterium HLUCCA12]